MDSVGYLSLCPERHFLNTLGLNMSYRNVFLGFIGFFPASLWDSAGAETKHEWRDVYRCEGDEAKVEQRQDDLSEYRISLRNQAINDVHLKLRYRQPTEGTGAPTLPGETFRGFSKVLTYFWKDGQPYAPLTTVHVFPDHGGLKVVVDEEPFYVCTYTPTFGDPGGSFASYPTPLGASCPDLRPHYAFRDASRGLDSKSSRNWFFQNCQSSNR